MLCLMLRYYRQAVCIKFGQVPVGLRVEYEHGQNFNLYGILYITPPLNKICH